MIKRHQQRRRSKTGLETKGKEINAENELFICEETSAVCQ